MTAVVAALIGSTYRVGDIVTFKNGMVGAITLNKRMALVNQNGIKAAPKHMPCAEAYLQLNEAVQIDVAVADPNSKSLYDKVKLVTLWATEERIKRLGITIVDEADYVVVSDGYSTEQLQKIAA